MAEIPELTTQESTWVLAGVGVVAAAYVIPRMPQWLGAYTGLAVGAISIFLAMRYIKNHSWAAALFGFGFGTLLAGAVQFVSGRNVFAL